MNISIPMLQGAPHTLSQPGDVPFVAEVEQDTFALCYPCDRVTYGNRYLFSNGKVYRAEGNRYNPGNGWRNRPQGVSPIGWVVSVHRRGWDGWSKLADNL